MQIEVTIWNNEGEIVVHEFNDAPTATQDEIDDMIRLIDKGCPAQIAAILARQHGGK